MNGTFTTQLMAYHPAGSLGRHKELTLVTIIKDGTITNYLNVDSWYNQDTDLFSFHFNANQLNEAVAYYNSL